MSNTNTYNMDDMRRALRQEMDETLLADVPEYVRLYAGEASLDGYYTPAQLRSIAAAIEAYTQACLERGIEAA